MRIFYTFDLSVTMRFVEQMPCHHVETDTHFSEDSGMHWMIGLHMQC